MNFLKNSKVFSIFSSPKSSLQIDGIYKMEVKIGEKIFTDLVQLKTEENNKLNGTVTLPGLFTAPLHGTYSYNEKNKTGNIEFKISTLEKGKKLEVLYTGIFITRTDSRIEFQGEAKDLSDGSVFGKNLGTSTRSR